MVLCRKQNIFGENTLRDNLPECQRYLIVGSGAIAITLAVRLILARQDVIIISSRLHGKQTIALESPSFQNTCNIESKECFSPELVNKNTIIILAQKIYQLQKTFRKLIERVPKHVPICCLQNGIWVENQLANYGFVTIPVSAHWSCTLVRDNHAFCGVDNGLYLGWIRKKHIPISKKLTFEFSKNGVHSKFDQSGMNEKYRKLLIASTSAYLAIRGINISSIENNTQVQEDLSVLLKESANILRKSTKSTKLSESMNNLILQFSKGRINKNNNKVPKQLITSLQQDLDKKLGITEVKWLNGELVKLSSKNQVNAPINSFLLKEVLKAEKQKLTTLQLSKNSILQNKLHRVLDTYKKDA
jgi:ketopantoate reductase